MERTLATAEHSSNSSSNSTEYEHHNAHHTDHHAPIYPIFFAFISILLGVILKNWVPRMKYFKVFPYTAVVFAIWTSISSLHFSGLELGSLGKSMDAWEAIDPHLMLFGFLPALLFGDAKATDTHLLMRKGKEILILASLGVLIGTALTAIVFRFILPYDWSWNLCFVMGSILAATDPVAVVGLLNDLGAPPALTMVISGESMFNDGTAIVVFNLFLSLYSKEFNIPDGFTTHAYTELPDIILYALTSIFGGAFFGVLGGILSVALLLAFDSKLHEDNALLQLSTTLSMAYLVFYVAEGIFGTSGVIAVVSMGMFFSEYSRGLVVSHEVLEAGWECFEFIGNTLIFSLAGLIVGKIIVDAQTSDHVDRYDILWCGVSWLFSFLTRMIMLCCIYPLMRYVRRNEWRNPSQRQSDAKDMLVEGWGGLRGAVGLALAILVRNQNASSSEAKNGTILLVHVTGVASLTLLINATTATPLLKKLGMTDPPSNHIKAVLRIHARIILEVKKFAETLIVGHNTADLGDIARQAVKRKELGALCTLLRDETEGETESSQHHTAAHTPAKKRYNKLSRRDTSEGLWEKRELLIKFVRAEYNDMIDHRAIILPPERHEASRILLNSTLYACDDLSNLGDWEVVERSIQANKWYLWVLTLWDACFSKCYSSSQKFMYLYKRRMDAYAMLLSFEKAHMEAQEHLNEIFPDDEEAAQVVDESRESCDKARKLRKHMDRRLKKRVSMEHLAARVLLFERQRIVKLTENGVLTGKDEHLLLHDNEKDFERLKFSNDHLPGTLAREATFKSSRESGRKLSQADQKSRTIYVPTTTNSKVFPGESVPEQQQENDESMWMEMKGEGLPDKSLNPHPYHIPPPNPNPNDESDDELDQQKILKTLESGLQSPGIGTGISDLKKTLLKENTGLSE
ncbi:hypothetical protein TrST_g10779 [Triparma strigata]|uniref:Cation/H+ exchanger transmembrane domain-containing protein n=1 Tax=Triparma strigata TaxID=1606541 RepID=A0A9W7C1Q8_9STRA|nr:hypothetical protein TrST_g10779 [Triparma strigata]